MNPHIHLIIIGLAIHFYKKWFTSYTLKKLFYSNIFLNGQVNNIKKNKIYDDRCNGTPIAAFFGNKKSL